MNHIATYQRGQRILKEIDNLIGKTYQQKHLSREMEDVVEQLYDLKHTVHQLIIKSFPDPPKTLLSTLTQINALFNKN